MSFLDDYPTQFKISAPSSMLFTAAPELPTLLIFDFSNKR